MLRTKRVTRIVLISIVVGIFAILFIVQNGRSFDVSTFNVDNSYKHIEELSSRDYLGRLAGSEGNEKALTYIENYFREIGVEPGGTDGSYYQSFNTIIPDIDTKPVFNITPKDNSGTKDFAIYEDYTVLTSMNGGPVDFYGEMLFVGVNLLRIDPTLIKDRIVVLESAYYLQPDRVNYVIENGGKGVICCVDTGFSGTFRRYELEKNISMAGKTGQAILVAYVSGNAYQYMLKHMDEGSSEIADDINGIISDVTIKVDMTFPIIETANILGKIEGKSSNGNVLMITANMDGTGEGTMNNYFPGALTNVSGMGTLLEIARVIASQENLPYETIVFVGWNAQQQQLAGSQYYINNPVYDLKNTTVIHLEVAGIKTLEGLGIYSDSINSKLFTSQITNYANDAGLMISPVGLGYSAINGFADERVPSVMLSDTWESLNTYEDTILNVDVDCIENMSLVILNYIKRDVFRDTGFDYLTSFEYILIILLLLGGMISSLISHWYNTRPNMILLGVSIEKLYLFSPIMLLRKFYKWVFPFFIVVFMLALLANIDPALNVKIVDGHIKTNFSGYLTIKNVILYLRTLVDPKVYIEQEVGNIFGVIFRSSYRSIILISASLLLASIVGIIRGIYEGYKAKKVNLRSMGTLVVFSVPDVMIVLLGLLFSVFVTKNFPGIKKVLPLDEFILPLVTLSIIPTIYISRISFLTIQDEIVKDYIKNAKAKGLSRKRIFFREMLPAIVFKIVDTLPAIMTMLLSSMLIVEYLFNYNGILYFLLYLYKRQDIYRFVPLAITLGLIYVLFTWGIQFIARLINPLKREVKNEKN